MNIGAKTLATAMENSSGGKHACTIDRSAPGKDLSQILAAFLYYGTSWPLLYALSDGRRKGEKPSVTA